MVDGPQHRPAAGGGRVRLVALYLPQFHPVPENDAWWGAGFTEWTNVAQARPLFRGHRQPDLPTELGFYDLRVPEVRQAQADLAAAHGIEAFCWYHYWFAGRRLLERPFTDMLGSGEPGFPFLLAWANQTWSGVWHGAPGRVLLEQTYPGPDDHRAHFAALEPAFHDRRYLRVEGRPAFYVYAPDEIPEGEAALELWRELARASGLGDLYLVGESRGRRRIAARGLDAVVPVHLPRTAPRGVRERVRRKRRGGPLRIPYARAAEAFLDPDADTPGVHPCVIPNWDNTPRSGRGGRVLEGSSPGAYRAALAEAVAAVGSKPAGRRLVFVKSWNEWAEGNHLEPDDRFGRGWLEATAAAVGHAVPAAGGTPLVAPR